jgi:hypothetical protein
MEAALGQIENVLVSGRLACTPSKSWNHKEYMNQDVILNFSIQLRMCKKWKK